MFVKICGINSRDALTAAVDAGTDALGFVFAESIREISAHKAALLCRDLPQTVRRVAVMRHPTRAQLEIVMKEFWPDWLQTDVADFDELSVPPDCIFRDTAERRYQDPEEYFATIYWLGKQQDKRDARIDLTLRIAQLTLLVSSLTLLASIISNYTQS